MPINYQLEPIHLLKRILRHKQHIIVLLHPIPMLIRKRRPNNIRRRRHRIQNPNRLHRDLLTVVGVELGDGLADLKLAVALLLEDAVHPESDAVLDDFFGLGVTAFLDGSGQGLEVVDLAWG